MEIKTNKKRQIKSDIYTYNNIEFAWTATVNLIDKVTGEKIKIDLSTKNIFSYMRQRYDYFKSQNQSYYENQNVIAVCCGVSERKVRDAIKLLNQLGLLKIYTRRTGTNQSNAYHSFLSLDEIEDKYKLINSIGLDAKTSVKEITQHLNDMPSLDQIEGPKSGCSEVDAIKQCNPTPIPVTPVMEPPVRPEQATIHAWNSMEYLFEDDDDPFPIRPQNRREDEKEVR
ncbi:DUF6945 domain-containing protein [Sodalis sp. RH19]|uniref:DUF6945 domain-containing protein n=1 Tax=Sodalis sp. RH19 TaxID=3394334 RepID=UPI0039B613D1